jgi:hypothetical protein
MIIVDGERGRRQATLASSPLYLIIIILKPSTT